MKSWESSLPYFTRKELECRHCGTIKLDLIFAAALVTLRHTWRGPLTPTSICRCPYHNKNERGHPNSLHLTKNPVHQTEGCAAIDIAWELWSKEIQLEFAQLAWSKGWSVGLNKIFIHLDARYLIKNTGLAQKVFGYDNWHFPFSQYDVRGS